MKKKSTSQSAFFSLRVVVASILCLASLALALFGMGAFSSAFAQTKGSRTNQAGTHPAAPGTQAPDVVRMVGPIRLNQDLRTLPYVAPKAEFEERILTRYPRGPGTGAHDVNSTAGLSKVEALIKSVSRPAPNMPSPLLTFDGVDVANSGGSGVPDSDGDVGPDHYV